MHCTPPLLQTLDVEVKSGQAAAVENWPGDRGPSLNPLFLLIPGIAGALVGCGLIFWGCRRSPRCRAAWQRLGKWWKERGARGMAAWQLPTAVVRGLGRSAQRYVRYAS